jgi:hypothetical protein
MPVSYPNKSEPEILPDPELNPLLNPLLAAHMGRWAEVYFTNPPEKRDQAVSELLRELENIPPEPASVEDIPDEHAKEITETADSPNWSSSTLEPLLTCSECAYNNSPDHEFCGMCGAPLVEWAERGRPHVAEAAPIGESWCERTLGGKPLEDPIEDAKDATEDTIEPAVSSTIAAARREAMELSGLVPEPRPKLMPKLVPKLPPKKDPHPRVGSLPRFYGFYRYHLYVGVGLAVLLVVASFMAWRGRDAHSRATASPAASAIPQPQPAPVDSAPPGTPASALPATQHASSVASPVASPVQSQASASPPQAQAPDSRIAPRSVPVVASSSAAAPPAQSGAEELAMAEKYLNPTRGTARDSGEAAEWLWKAVRKRNLEATLALSDLYARGDGVTKSCDQARLLLDAAARKGGKGAGERLRNLQAFGCQ